MLLMNCTYYFSKIITGRRLLALYPRNCKSEKKTSTYTYVQYNAQLFKQPVTLVEVRMQESWSMERCAPFRAVRKYRRKRGTSGAVP